MQLMYKFALAFIDHSPFTIQYALSQKNKPLFKTEQ